MVKGFKDAKGKFIPIGNKSSSHSKGNTNKTEGLRLRRNFSNPQIQSLIFPKKKFSESDAKRWAKSQGFKAPKTDITENSIRIRQFSPKQIKKGACRTIPLGSDVKAVLCDVRMKRVIDAEEEALLVKRLHDRNLSTEKVTEEDEFGETVTFLHITISKEQTLDAINGNRDAGEIVDHITGMTEPERLRNNITISNGLYKLEMEGKIKTKDGKWMKI